MTNPDWLTLRHGSLRPGLNDATLLVMLEDHPRYKLVVAPAMGKFTCTVTQTVNGKRLDDGALIAPSVAEAQTAGLEALRTKLGW